MTTKLAIMTAVLVKLILSTFMISLTFSVTVIEGGFAINEQDTQLLLYDLLEEALTGNSSNLLKLQHVYYHPAGKSARDIQLSATVTFVVNDFEAHIDHDFDNINGCSMLSTCHREVSFSHCRNYFSFVLSLYDSNNDDGSLQISDLVGVDGYDTFKIFDPSFSYVLGTLAIPQFLNVLFRDSFKDDDEMIELYFNITDQYLEFMPDYAEICDALSMLLVWVSQWHS